MNFSKMILVIFTLNFSINAFSADCNFIVFHDAKFGSENNVKDMIKDKCKLGYMSCFTDEGDFVTINPKKLTLTYTANDVSEKQCEEKALKACKFLKDDNISLKRVAVRYGGKPLNAFQCGANNGVKVAISEKLKNQVDSKQIPALAPQPSQRPKSIKTKVETVN